MTREEAIKHLENMKWLKGYSNTTVDGKPLENVIDDIIALLKVHEPRLITVKDFENNPNVDNDGFLPAWVEYRRDGDWGEFWEGRPDEWVLCKEDRIAYESMRYWTSRPTDEQREAVPWNAQK